MRQLNDREQRIFILCIITVLIYISYRMVVRPTYDNSLELEQQIETSKKRLRKALKVVKNGVTIFSEYNNYLDGFGQGKSDEEEMSSMINKLESVGKQINVRFSEMKPKRIAEVDFYKKFSISLKAEGSFGQISRFLYTLQKQPFLFQVDKFRLEKKTQHSPSLKIYLVLSKILISESAY